MSSSNKRASFGNGRLSPKAIRLLMLAGLIALLAICYRIGTGMDYQTAAPIPETEESMDQDFSYLAMTREDQKTQADRPVPVSLDEIEGDYLIEDAGEYLLSFSMHSGDHKTNYHRLEHGLQLRVKNRKWFDGLVSLPVQWSK